jgi:hypothetical protein
MYKLHLMSNIHGVPANLPCAGVGIMYISGDAEPVMILTYENFPGADR